MNTVELLKTARDHIAKGWCQRAFARTAEGIGVRSHNPNACSFCTLGAIYAVVDVLPVSIRYYDLCALSDAVTNALNVAIKKSGTKGIPYSTQNSESIARWNDYPERTKEEVLAVYDSAIQAESAISSES